MELFRKSLLLSLVLSFLVAPSCEACRFWVTVSDEIKPEFLKSQLVETPFSLKQLGEKYDDGWSVAYYQEGMASVIRSEKPSHLDDDFHQAVGFIGNTQSKIVMGHLRRASSGCVEGVPNPHPFVRLKNGKNWLFGHNGGVDKKLLIDLIGKKYLAANEPATCTYNAPDSWVDSELYFLFLLKNIEQAQWDVAKGLQNALNQLYKNIEEENRYLNFFLSDGDTVWTFRKGTSLFYAFDKKLKSTTVTSTIPDETDTSWETYPENNIAVLKLKKKPEFIDVSDSN